MAQKYDPTTLGKYAYDLDPLIQRGPRLGILIALWNSSRSLSFKQLLYLCDLTEGNLSRHMQRLEENQVIKVKKQFKNKRPLATCL